MVSLGSRLASCSVLALGLLACRATPAGSGTEPASVRSRNEHTRSVHLIDLYGRRVAPLASAGRPVVCVFVATACRGSAHYASEVRRLAAEFGAGFDFWVIYADPGDDFNEVRRHAREQDYGGRAARDPLQALAGLAGIVTTPAAAVFDAGGTLLYSGRIDDAGTGPAPGRDEPTVRDLERVLLVVLSGTPEGFEASLPIRTRTAGRPLPTPG